MNNLDMDMVDMDELRDQEGKTREEKLQEMRGEKQKRGGKSKSRRWRLLGMLLGVTALMVLLCGGIILYERISGRRFGDLLVSGAAKGDEEKEDEADGSGAAGEAESGAVEVLSNAIIYSQEELDKKIAEALEAAQKEEADRVLSGIKESLSAGATTIETLRPYYPDDIVVVNGGKFCFVPINRDLKMNSLDVANLQVLESGEYQYLTDGLVSSHKGIDVSSHQGKIDWAKVAQDGVEFAIIRLGYRGYGKEGKLVEDKYFQENIKGAKAAGIKVGVYLFSQAITEEEVLQEANMVLEKIAPYELDCPVVYDVERTSADGRMNNISVEERTNLTLRFCQAIENAGYRPMIYHNTQMGALYIDLAPLEAYDKWYASYSDQMFYPYEYKIWQYSDKGKVQGINTDVDLNISFAPIWK